MMWLLISMQAVADRLPRLGKRGRERAHFSAIVNL